jgi:hypothetical protein
MEMNQLTPTTRKSKIINKVPPVKMRGQVSLIVSNAVFI